jgi:hypothetical protein
MAIGYLLFAGMQQIAHCIQQAVRHFLGIDVELAIRDGRLDAFDLLAVEHLTGTATGRAVVAGVLFG